jgi:hypothetical protein
VDDELLEPVALGELVPVELLEPVPVDDELLEPVAPAELVPVELLEPVLDTRLCVELALGEPSATGRGDTSAARSCSIVVTFASARGGELHSPLGSSHRARLRTPALNAWL